MSEWTPLDWIGFIVGYFGIAGIALWLLDRSHRNAIDKLREAYQENRADQQLLIDVLQMVLDQVRRDWHELRGTSPKKDDGEG